MKTSKNNTKKGFSLLEILMVLFIITLMTGALFVSLRSNRKKGDLEVAARLLVAEIRKAQNDAVSGRKTSATNKTCGLGIALGVAAGSDRTNFIPKKSEEAVCDGSIDAGTVTNDGAARTLKSSFKSSTEKLVFDLTDEKWLFFSNPHARPFYGDSTGVSILNSTLKLSLKRNNAGSDIVDICIYPSGRIMEGPVHASGTTWNCP